MKSIPAFRVSRKLSSDPYLGIMLHHTAGSFLGACAQFRSKDPTSRTSSHYVISHTGVFQKITPDGYDAHHAGAASPKWSKYIISNAKYFKLQFGWSGKTISRLALRGNSSFIGIELEFPPSLATVVKDPSSKFGTLSRLGKALWWEPPMPMATTLDSIVRSVISRYPSVKIMTLHRFFSYRRKIDPYPSKQWPKIASDNNLIYLHFT